MLRVLSSEFSFFVNNSIRKHFYRKCQEDKVVPHEIFYTNTTRTWPKPHTKVGNFLQREENYSHTVILLFIILFELTFTFWLFQNLTLILSPKYTQIYFLTHTFTQTHISPLTHTLTFLHILIHIFIFLLPLGLINKFIHTLEKLTISDKYNDLDERVRYHLRSRSRSDKKSFLYDWSA